MNECVFSLCGGAACVRGARAHGPLGRFLARRCKCVCGEGRSSNFNKLFQARPKGACQLIAEHMNISWYEHLLYMYMYGMNTSCHSIHVYMMARKKEFGKAGW